ncbi:MAG: type II toxin-antitoxin system prevent-host-death family antitoxin [Phenylobacterium sp.]|uniref:type II toxin-antitoxin system prevent-host-death family antitoxin n=1 Tax=Phenylobacterium sp. TaxID=1871053 RepID=UPI003919F8B7
MTVTTITSRDFNQDAGKAKKAASRGPVFITDRGRPAHVLLTIEDYRTLVGERQADIVELLALEPPIETFEPERLDGEYYRPADFS